MEFSHLSPSPTGEYSCQIDLNLYNSPTCQGLATQAAKGRQLRILEQQGAVYRVQLCEDDYLAWLPVTQGKALQPSEHKYCAPIWSREAIAQKIPEIIAFTHHAMTQPHHYLWGGTVAPHYDCSGLMQAAFAASGIWLPRDSYQQETFTQKVPWDDLLPGDLIFFQETTRVTHVALYLGHNQYIHSSGIEKGRNGIGIDSLSPDSGSVGSKYYPYLLCAGRVMTSWPG
ncbi:C40 family peptidase [Spirulina subsalsa FACHB-351]|uniref:C40 family peptidase n=1 Tax=Spirulina subsalsa FACHB-351 TaxID=234711 RepID=A0ABT3LB99_9CYAN|nr:C40 family peptidase [Spirulina subsalsa]MCW6038789.1 C40 family peptidase [Spirulina subsalsa FACHB-351]